MKASTPLLILLLLLAPTIALAKNNAPRSLFDWSTEWTEDKFLKQVKKNDKAVNQKQWTSALRSGEIALDGCTTLYGQLDQRCIIIMKNNVQAYANTGQIAEHATEITQAYQLATQAVGKQHFTTIIIRDTYRQLLMDQEHYEQTIPILIEMIEVEKSLQNDEFKILDWEILLYALYKITEQHQYQEPTLLRMLALTEKLIGVDSDNFERVAISLAEHYCEQKHYNKFFDLSAKYSLKTECVAKK